LVFGLGTAGQAFTLIPFSTVKASEGFSGADADSDTANKPRYTVSDDGCFVVFTSRATKLTATQSDGNSQADVFLYESCGIPQVTLVSHVEGDPDKAANGRSDQPVISPDSRFVVFRSTAPDIVEGTGYGPRRTSFSGIGSTLSGQPRTATTGRRDGDPRTASSTAAPASAMYFESSQQPNDSQAADTSQIYRYELGSGRHCGPCVPCQLRAAGHRGRRAFLQPGDQAPVSASVHESEARNLVRIGRGRTNLARDVFR
jgi:hypothetical protein